MANFMPNNVEDIRIYKIKTLHYKIVNSLKIDGI